MLRIGSIGSLRVSFIRASVPGSPRGTVSILSRLWAGILPGRNYR